VKKTIVYIFFYKFNKKYLDDYQIKFLSRSFNLHVIDFSFFFNKSLDKDKKYFKNKSINFHIIRKENELLKILKDLNCNCVAMFGDESSKSYIGNLLRKNIELKIIEFILGDTPDEYYSLKDYLKKIIYFNLFNLNFFKDIFTKVILFIKRKLKNTFFNKVTYIPDLVFCAGKLSQDRMNKIKRVKKIISTHSFDFEKKYNKKKFFLKKKIIVYYDKMIMHHRDYRRKDIRVPVTKSYFNKLNDFFYYLENRYNCKVVIALHPRCEITSYKRLFNNRECYKNLTYEITKKAIFVLTDPATTAISFPVILKRPMVFITSNELNNSLVHFIRLTIRKILFKQPIINIDDSNSYKTIKNYQYIDKSGYRNYFINYIKNNSHDASHKRIFVKGIKSL
jgi:hypothetical protein